jgi:hypothetical protein
VNVKGYGTHVTGGAAWGGHTCPGPGPRAGQRYEIISRAKALRAGQAPWTSDGSLSLNGLAAQLNTQASSILAMTAITAGAFATDTAAYINGVFAGTTSPDTALPAGLVLWVPAT